MKKKINSLYIHIPFCHDICHYCDFSKVLYFPKLADQYLLSLERELASYHINKDLKTVYIGGGTPTSLSDKQFSFLLSLIDPYCQKVEEYTIEANPESLSISKLKIMKAHGVNRISLGVESTNDEILKAINRHHDFEMVKKVFSNARKIGFDNLSCDLILGLPNVSKTMLIRDIENILSLNPDHISCYSLTVHPNTRFGLDHIKERSDDELRDSYDLVNSLLEKNGYIHYEISNWSKPNKQSQHNFTYWKDEEYYGLGLGASGYVDGYRYTNTRNLNKYIDGEYLQEKEFIEPQDDEEYFIMLNLRTNRGIIFDEYEKRFHEDFKTKYQDVIEKLVRERYLIKEENCIYPTYSGMMILDQIILDFYTR